MVDAEQKQRQIAGRGQSAQYALDQLIDQRPRVAATLAALISQSS
jgi:hypothetical protein